VKRKPGIIAGPKSGCQKFAWIGPDKRACGH
jgi:hypothetical protein